MVLRNSIRDREYDKFDANANGDTAVRVIGDFGDTTISISGLNVGGRVSEVIINDTTWTPLPAVPLSQRNAISIQNEHPTLFFRLNYDSGAPFVGPRVFPNGERFYDITENVIIYARCATGTMTVVVEELA